MPVVLHGIEALRPEHGPVLLVVGVFDGLHRGHMYLLRELRRAARRLDARPAVLTFDHHPDEILAGMAPPLLCDPDERIARLERGGVAVTVVEHFDEELRRTSFEDFVAAIRARTQLAGFVMTPDAAFGHERRGTPQALATLGRAVGFEVVVVPPFDFGGRQVRSTEVRAAIAAGDLAAARELIGRRVAVTGVPVEVDAAGRRSRLAFPLPVALPPEGTYVASVCAPMLPDAVLPSRAGGGRVTIDGEGVSLEVARTGGLVAGRRVRVAFAGPGPGC
jgi:riboflavin kinase / FMN adenylyltransferase